MIQFMKRDLINVCLRRWKLILHCIICIITYTVENIDERLLASKVQFTQTKKNPTSLRNKLEQHFSPQSQKMDYKNLKAHME